ncbi:hypothetical protein DSO57_1003507 [Entomophthora muscae]|uniref:Uncharacterized protein n=1 Tax=Entomophthora muscae TaxID=34485 RepID=A0ACC2RNE7_9FUNG|nr:hypothetical protein DSO57_1003507 [Entomophthora muscae]
MSYSERVRQGLETELNKEGFIPYEDFLRELATQGNPYKTIPRLSLNHAICIHVNNLSKGSIKKCMETIFDALDTSFPALQVDNHLAVSEGYLDIGFDSDEQKKEALSLEIQYNGIPLKVEATRYNKQRAKWVTFTNLPTHKDRHWVQEAIVTGLSYYGDIVEVMVEGSGKARCMRPKTIHVLLDMAPIVKERDKTIPRFIRLPGCNGTVTYVEPETERPVCRFCYQMRHTAFHCTHRKSAHYSEIDQDEGNGVTKVKNNTFFRPKPKWWLPTNVAEILDMKAIKKTMTELHKADWERIEALSNREEAEDHDDPSTPKTVHMDKEPTVADRTIHPDADVWQKANRKTKPEKQQKKKGNQKQGPKDPQSTPPNPQPFKINTPAKPNKPPKGKGNPIPIPGENHGMTTDFTAS